MFNTPYTFGLASIQYSNRFFLSYILIRFAFMNTVNNGTMRKKQRSQDPPPPTAILCCFIIEIHCSSSEINPTGKRKRFVKPSAE